MLLIIGVLKIADAGLNRIGDHSDPRNSAVDSSVSFRYSLGDVTVSDSVTGEAASTLLGETCAWTSRWRERGVTVTLLGCIDYASKTIIERENQYLT